MSKRKLEDPTPADGIKIFKKERSEFYIYLTEEFMVDYYLTYISLNAWYKITSKKRKSPQHSSCCVHYIFLH